MGLLAEDDACPFCAQNIQGLPLVEHYRSYFSAAYQQHRERIASAQTALDEALGGDRLARFQRLLQAAKETREFWSTHLKLPDFDVDSEQLEQRWTAVRTQMNSCLDEKARAPLETVVLGADAQAAQGEYESLADHVRSLSAACLERNADVARAKEKATHGNLTDTESHLALLETTQRRFEKETSELCGAYLRTRAEKAQAEKDKQTARKALNEHRIKAFRKYQTVINEFLSKFNADFRLDDFAVLDGRGGLSSTYQLGVNQSSIPLTTKDGAPPQPSFRTALSAGDRNTLSLALFFAQLGERKDLKDAIVVIDDPASSLDDHRSWATVNEIQQLIARTQQVIVLAHSTTLLCRFWEQVGDVETATLEICDAAAEESTIKPWNVEAESTSEYDRLHKLVREFANHGTADADRVAPALRVVLEGYLRVAFNEHCPAGRLLGTFLNVAKVAAEKGTPMLPASQWTQLDQLRVYANQFHHDTNDRWQENLTNLNRKQLQGFARQVVAFTRLAGTAPSSGT